MIQQECVNCVSSLEEIINIITSEKFDKLGFHWLKSAVPDKCYREPCLLGVDEAGRGPVLGPMVYSVFYCPAKSLDILKKIGCTDSKVLTERKREEIFGLINKHKDDLGWAVDVISPNLISNNMQKRVKCSLNEIAQNSTIKLIQSVIEKVNVEEIYVDTLGPPEKYQEKLSNIFIKSKVFVEKKADSLYPAVGAASICAKVIRDTVVKHWKFSELIKINENNFGTGYPGDPKTKQFLVDIKDDIFGYPNIVRFSWSTAFKSLEKNTAVEWDDKTEENHESPSISCYFKPIKSVKRQKCNCKFFEERSMNRVCNF